MWLLLLIGAVAAYLLLKLVRLLVGDTDLVVRSLKMKPEYFQGRVIWVTGASSGIGEELCYRLSKMGAKLILSARNEERLEEVKGKLANPNDACVLPVDLSDPEATRAATKKAKNIFGKIDILVNNAALGMISFFGGVEEHALRKVMEVNSFAPWILTHEILPGMIDDGFGHILNISSVSAKTGHPYTSSYSSSKYSLSGTMDSLNYEMIDNKNIFMTNSVPGPVDTKVIVNSLKGDGTISGRSAKLTSTGMSIKRCAEVTLIGCSNQLNEVWMANQPVLASFYFAQYMPTIHSFLMGRLSRQILKSGGGHYEMD